MKDKIVLSNEARLKMKYFVEKAPGEISGMCKSTVREDGSIYVTDCIIFDQVSSSAHTEISEAAMAVFLTELVRAKDKPENWNIWWHSHASLNVFWSGTDTKTIEDHTSQKYLISIVTNKKGEYKGRLDIFPTDHSPFKKESICTYDDLTIEEEEPLDKYKVQKDKLINIISTAREKLKEIADAQNENPEIEAWVEEEIKAKLKEPAPVTCFGKHDWRDDDYGHLTRKERRALNKESEQMRLSKELGYDDNGGIYEDDYYNAGWHYEDGILTRDRQKRLPAGLL